MADNQDLVLKIRVRDPQGSFLRGTADIGLEHTRLSEHQESRDVDTSREIEIRGLRRGPEALYKVIVTLSNPFRQQGKFVNIPSSGLATLDFVFDWAGKPVEPETQGDFKVRGFVRHPNGAAAPDVVVRAFDRDLRSEELLGTATTGEDGGYEIRYSAEQFRRAEKRSADLVVRAFDAQDREIATSWPLFFNAGPETMLNLVVGNEVYRGPSENELLAADLTPLLQGLSLADLTEDDQHQDVSFLSGETGEDPGRITLLILAHRLLRETEVAAEVFYGMFRQGLPTSLPALLAQSPDVLRRSLVRSAAENIIPARFGAQAGEIVEGFKALLVKEAMKPAGDGDDRAGLNELLGLTLNEDQRRVFLEASVGHTGSAEELWNRLAALPELSDRIPEIQLTLQLGALTGNYVPLVKALQQRGLKAARELAKIKPQEWEALIGQHGFPSSVQGASPEEQAASYQAAIQQWIDSSFPTAAIGRELAEDPEADAGIRAFFEENPDFELGKVPVRQYLAKVGGAAPLLRELENMERVFHVTQSYQSMMALIRAGLDSASKIAQMGPPSFVRVFSDTFGGETEALSAFKRADHYAAVAACLLGTFGPSPWLDPRILGSIFYQPDSGPEWRTFFGSLDSCTCRHGRSVLAPAAYFDDLLSWLETWKVAAGLRLRRPDLFALELSCANTETELPYIDLVNEILENEISPSRLPIRTDASAAELRAQPHSLSSSAYGKLRNEVHPWTLPFDLWETEAGIYLERFGVKRHELMEAFRGGRAPSDSEIAGARLGLGPVERRIIAGESLDPPRNLWEHYGFTVQEDWLGQLAVVARFLERTGLNYDELSELRQLRLINPDGLIEIKPKPPAGPETCNLEELVILNLTEPRLDLLHRLVRLQRRLGWPMREIDRVIATLRPGVIDGTLLIGLDLLDQLSRDLHLPIRYLLTFYDKLDTYAYRDGADRPLYDELFLNPAVLTLSLGEHPLDLDATRSDLEDLSRELTDPVAAAIVRGALSLGQDEWTALVGPTPGVTPDGKLNRSNLTLLARMVFLARGLEMPVSDLLRMIRLSGQEPFATLPTEAGQSSAVDLALACRATLDFVRAVRTIQKSDVPVAETILLLCGDTDPASPATPPDETLARLLEDLRGSVQEVIDSTRGRTDFDGSLTLQRLATLGWPTSLVDEAIATPLGRVRYITHLDALPLGLSFPQALQTAISYDSEAKILMRQGPMSQKERSSLKELSENREYRQAVEELFAAPRSFVSLQMQAFTLPTFLASLDTLPKEVEFPPDFNERITFDAKAKTLTWKGFMDRTACEGLLKLSNNADADSDYRKAVNALFTASAAYVPEAGNAFLTAADADAMFDDPEAPEGTVAGRLGRVLEKLQNHLRRTQSEVVVLQKLASALGLDPVTAESLLGVWLEFESQSGTRQPVLRGLLSDDFIASDPSGQMSRSMFPDAFGSLSLAFRVSFVLKRLKLQGEELPLLFRRADAGGGGGWLDLNALPLMKSVDPQRFGPWVCLLELVHLLRRLPKRKPHLFQILENAFAYPPHHVITAPGAPEDLRSDLASLTGWSGEDLEYLAGNFERSREEVMPGCLHLSFPGEWRTGEAIARLADCFALLRRLGVSASQVKDWAQPEIGEEAVVRLRQAVKARTGGETWLEIAGPLRSGLREKQRDALTSYLVSRAAGCERKWKDVNGLYSYFLIDVEMSSCQLTSRLKQAISSVQLFVQRCLMKLEDTTLPPEAAQEWKWRRNYRVWEAARRIFLFPENWAELELRDDKSPFFKELESALLQGEVTDANVEEAVRTYLDKLHEVARPLMVGMCYDDSTSPPTVHAFGRTRQEPRQYFYRRWVDGAFWTPWEKINVQIEGDHLAPIVYNRRLFLFWAVFAEVAEDNQVPETEATPEQKTVKKHWEVRLAWSDYRNGRWSLKKVMQEVLRLDGADPSGIEAFQLRGSVQDQKLCLRLYTYSAKSLPLSSGPIAECSLSPCDDTLVITTPTVLDEPVFSPEGTTTQAERFREDPVKRPTIESTEDPGDELTLFEDGPEGLINFDVLTATPGLFEVLFPHHTPQPEVHQPFFFQDDQRTFFALPQEPPWQPGKASWSVASVLGLGTQVKLIFQTFYHPQVCRFIERLEAGGMEALLRQPACEEDLDFFADEYGSEGALSRVAKPYPIDRVAFCQSDAYSLYNWELFFHIPLLIADRLSKNQRFEEAQRWFHFIFDPTDTSSDIDTCRFWKFQPFARVDRAGCDPSVDLLRLAGRTPPLSELEQAVLERQIKRWRRDPFQPHAIARLRWSAYQKLVVMKYLDNLIAWGDNLFCRETLEALNEATQVYILAAEILGDRPQEIPPRNEPEPQSHDDLGGSAQVGNSIEVDLPVLTEYGVMKDAADKAREFFDTFAGKSGAPSPVEIFRRTGYFCLPANDKLLCYWDTVADRLFKVRHCMNIEGIVRKLPLFEPPIDPALLVRAAAAGLDLGAVLGGELAAPRPHYRFAPLAQKAGELCAEVKALGAALLSALEKRDAEALALLRSEQELALLGAARAVKEQQVNEAEQSLSALREGRKVVTKRWQHYRDIEKYSGWEKGQMGLMLAAAGFQHIAQSLEAAAAVAAETVPDFTYGSAGSMGSPVELFHEGGTKRAESGSRAAGALRILADKSNLGAQMAGLEAGHQRRWDDWKLQERLAEQELKQIDQQILAAEIRKAITLKELANHDLHVENVLELDRTMREKFTNRELYDWMIGQISGTYFQSYRLAYDVAKRAERAFRHELGLRDSSFIQFGYWDSLKKGLLAGERLFHDIKRMEVAYLDQHRREYELTKQISLARLDPLALIRLRETGTCMVSIPEAFFDLDFPGHYLRRIKSVSVSIPCVTGPHTSVNCTLTLLRTSVRHGNTLSSGKYGRLEGDPRFTDSLGAIQSIATSRAQEDSGLFEPNLRDERFLPFEGAGAVSEWQIELPPVELSQFDYDTISDVILHMRYTARDGGGLLKQQATKELKNALNELIRAEGRQEGLAQILSVRHELPAAWHDFLNPSAEAEPVRKLALDLGEERFPLVFARRELKITGIELFIKVNDGFAETHNEDTLKMTLTRGAVAPDPREANEDDLLLVATWNGLLRAELEEDFSRQPGLWTLNACLDDEGVLDPKAFREILLICHYTCS